MKLIPLLEDTKRVVINLKPSHRIVAKFKSQFPNATWYGAATLGSRSKSYLIPADEYEKRKDDIKKLGTKSKVQPFL